MRKTLGRCFSSSHMCRADCTHAVIGAGAVGLAVARKLADRSGTSTILLERHGSVGTETSSRNSEVIHAGIYYGPSSLKTELCIKGKQMMYNLCQSQNIPYRNCKKWVLAQNAEQHGKLVELHETAKTIGVPVSFLPLQEAHIREPDIQVQEAVLESPTTGIIDSHSYMSFLEADFRSKGGDLARHTTVESIEPLQFGAKGWKIVTKTGSAQETAIITAETIVNSAGLFAVPLANSILPSSRQIRPYYAKGSYYSYNSTKPRPTVLVYPAPTTGAAGLGTHLTMDMAGSIRFGPDVEWVEDPDEFSVNDSQLPAALNEIQAYLPSIQRDKVQIDYCGIRPKLGKGGAVWKGKGEGFLDFVIRKEDGYQGLVNLLGIESPGLTSSLAIADMVDTLLYN